MNRKREALALTAGLIIGTTIASPAAMAVLTATPSAQQFFVNGQRVNLEAYAINGSNYIKLRDIGQAVGFDVEYDAVTNSVQIGDATAGDGVVIFPADGSQYVPQAGDVLRATNDGTTYTISDVSRWDASAFADGPLGDLPAPTCDWSLLDQPALPEPEARHYTVGGKEYLFVRNLYETRRMLYTLYNAIGNNEQTWRDGAPVLRKDGTQLVRIELTIPTGSNPYTFWPWKEEQLTELFNSCPPGTYQMEAWDVYKDGVFQKTEYNVKVK